MPAANTKENGAYPGEVIPTPVMPGTPNATVPPRARIVVPPIRLNLHAIPIIGLTPLVTHPYAEKLLKQWEEDRAKDAEVEEKVIGAKKGRGGKVLPPRNYKEEYQASLYHLDGGHGYGMPAIAFKRALVDACKLVGNIEPWAANMILFVHGPYQSKGVACVKIIGEPHCRRDTVKLQGPSKPPDNRFRAEFFPWEAELMIEFDASFISLKSIYNLVHRAGYNCGVGEMRPTAPKKPNDFGRWNLKKEEVIDPPSAESTPSTKRTKKGG